MANRAAGEVGNCREKLLWRYINNHAALGKLAQGQNVCCPVSSVVMRKTWRIDSVDGEKHGGASRV